MNTVEISLLVLLALLLSVYRQTRTRPASRMTGTLVTAAALVVLGVNSGGLLDTGQPALSLALFAVEAVAAVALGAWRASSVRVWLDDAGIAWSKGTAGTMLAWLASIAIRVGLYFAGTAAGLSVSTGGALLFLGLTLGTQAYLVARRGRALIGDRILSKGDA
ncbi:hypothetical protein AB0C27_03550 [Nonomuraea sp. NPDC048882]|uniref:hypothetical protein n=1 Tax=Nonomuraea sp. NPDC048882 TaxID=3154347 RepID=UPI003405F601